MRPRPRGASTARGIDTLLGDETRPHGDDLDLAVVRADLPRLEAVLPGFGLTPRPAYRRRPGHVDRARWAARSRLR